MNKLLNQCPILDINAFGDHYHLVTNPNVDVKLSVESALQAAGVTGYEISEISPTLEDIFVHLAGGGEA
jgi:ABC-2 type transport system ATP-binding protein